MENIRNTGRDENKELKIIFGPVVKF